MKLEVGDLVILRTNSDYMSKILEINSEKELVRLALYKDGNLYSRGMIISLPWVCDNYRRPTEKEIEFFQMKGLSGV